MTKIKNYIILRIYDKNKSISNIKYTMTTMQQHVNVLNYGTMDRFGGDKKKYNHGSIMDQLNRSTLKEDGTPKKITDATNLYSIFVRYIKLGKMDGYLDNPQNSVTIFVPYNKSLYYFDTSVKVDYAIAREVVKAHIVNSIIPTKNMVYTCQKYTNLNDDYIVINGYHVGGKPIILHRNNYVDKRSGFPTIFTKNPQIAMDERRDIVATNGLIQIIDVPLIPNVDDRIPVFIGNEVPCYR